MLDSKSFAAGTLESSDAYITVEEGSGIEVNLESSVIKQFGNQIRGVISETLEELDVHHAKVTVVDRGALNCTIKARLSAAIARARKENESWGV